MIILVIYHLHSSSNLHHDFRLLIFGSLALIISKQHLKFRKVLKFSWIVARILFMIIRFSNVRRNAWRFLGCLISPLIFVCPNSSPPSSTHSVTSIISYLKRNKIVWSQTQACHNFLQITKWKRACQCPFSNRVSQNACTLLVDDVIK